MQKQQLTSNTEPAIETEIRPGRPTSQLFQPAKAPGRHRTIRIPLPKLPRRQSCLTKRAMLAALREAELAGWRASGGDYLDSLYQPVR